VLAGGGIAGAGSVPGVEVDDLALEPVDVMASDRISDTRIAAVIAIRRLLANVGRGPIARSASERAVVRASAVGFGTPGDATSASVAFHEPIDSSSARGLPTVPSMRDASERDGLRLAELVACLSLAVDLGLGQPMEHLLRSCLIGLRLAERVGMTEDKRAVVYYVALLGWVGCHADAHEQSALFGDDIALKADRFTVDMRGAARAGYVLRHLASGQPPLQRVRTLGTLLVSARELGDAFEPTHCRIAGEVAIGLGLGGGVGEALLQVFERWDGGGSPEGLAGGRLALATRIVQLAMVVEFHRRVGGVEAAFAVARRRSGRQFDPELVDRFCTSAREILAGLDVATSWDEVIDSEPALRPCVSIGELDGALGGGVGSGGPEVPVHDRSLARSRPDRSRGGAPIGVLGGRGGSGPSSWSAA
jgi:hypothetical protein